MKVIVFGANSDGIKFLQLIKSFSYFMKIEVVCILDNDSRLHGTTLGGHKIFPVDAIGEFTFDKVIVCPIFQDEIVMQLKGLEVDESKIELWQEDVYFSKEARNIRGSLVGAYSYFKSNTILNNCVIGKFCHIGDNCIIGQAGHRVDLPTTYPLHYHFSNDINDVFEDRTKDSRRLLTQTLIGNDVYIGESVVVQGGVKIGDGAVIASRSVITKDVPPYSIVAGIPGKVLKKRFSEDVIVKLLKIKWWDREHQLIESNLHTFTSNVDEFINHWINNVGEELDEIK